MYFSRRVLPVTSDGHRPSTGRHSYTCPCLLCYRGHSSMCRLLYTTHPRMSDPQKRQSLYTWYFRTDNNTVLSCMSSFLSGNVRCRTAPPWRHQGAFRDTSAHHWNSPLSRLSSLSESLGCLAILKSMTWMVRPHYWRHQQWRHRHSWRTFQGDIRANYLCIHVFKEKNILKDT